MGLNTYFFDTYAFFELIKGNKNYDKYNEDNSIVTTKLNLMELHYGLLINFGVEEANKYYNEFVKFAVDIDDDIIFMSNRFRALMKKRKLSYIDCLGYTIAKIRGIKFLTGDKGFSDLDGVEYVK